MTGYTTIKIRDETRVLLKSVGRMDQTYDTLLQEMATERQRQKGGQA